MCIDRRINKQKVGLQVVEYHSAIKGGKSDIYFDMEKPWKHFAKWNKPSVYACVLSRFSCV